MNNPNRYEEVPQKENVFVKILKTFGRYLKFTFIDFINSFKYNNMKLAAILFALPGLFLGFFMFAHVPTIRNVQTSYKEAIPGTDVNITAALNAETSDPTDYTLTLNSYTINDTEYKNVVLVKNAVDTSVSSFDQSINAVDGFAQTAKQTTQLPAPKVTISPIESNKDIFNVKLTGITDEDMKNIASFSLFIYEVDADTNLQYQIMFGNKTGVVISDAEAGYNATYNFLNKDKKYAVVAKSIPVDGTEFYPSNLSDPSDSFSPSDNGSGYTLQQYVEKSTSYIKYQGTYSAASADGYSTANDDLKSLSVDVQASGNITYKVGDKSVDARISGDKNLSSYAQRTVSIIPFDFSGIAIFALTLFGFLSVFISLELSKKKNLGSVIKAILITVVIVGVGAAYVAAIVSTGNAIDAGKLQIVGVTTMYDTNCIISISTVIASAVFSLAGVILAFINYDRTYEKVDR